MHVYPAPSVVGTIKLAFVGGISGSIQIGSDINLPNNLIPYLKYGVEADIFSKEGVTQDARAAYCKQRWEEGIQIGLNCGSVLLAKANGRNILLDSISNLDLFSQALIIRYAPTVLGFAGYNLFATNTTPVVESSISLSIIANAKIPVNDDDFVRVDLEYIPLLVDYVVHLSKIKSGAAELAATEDLKNKFIKTSLNHNERLQFRGVTYEALVGTTKKEEIARRRVVRT